MTAQPRLRITIKRGCPHLDVGCILMGDTFTVQCREDTCRTTLKRWKAPADKRDKRHWFAERMRVYLQSKGYRQQHGSPRWSKTNPVPTRGDLINKAARLAFVSNMLHSSRGGR